MMPIFEPVLMLPKRWLWLILLFVALQIYFTRKGIQTFPFFHYGMYSAPVSLHDTVETFAVQVNGELLHLPPYVHDFWNKQVAFVYHQKYRVPLAVLPYRITPNYFPNMYAKAQSRMEQSAVYELFRAWNIRFLKPYVSDMPGTIQIVRYAQTAENWAQGNDVQASIVWNFTGEE